MADEGIMALPQGTGMQGEQPPVQQAVTSADSYDAAQTALGRVNPGGQAALKEALRQNIGNLQLTPQQLDALIQVFEYVSQHPGDYVNLLQKMLEAGVLDEGDMPPEYDPEFIGAMLAVLNEMQQMQAAGAQEPMDLSPVVQGLQPMGMASGGLADIGQYLASKGRGGDSMLAHINPEEAAMLKRRGGSGTINPNTGLPEFKEGGLTAVFGAIGGALKGVADVAKDLLKSPVGRILGTIALATVLGPAGVGLSMGVAGGLAGAGTSLLAGGSVKEALVSGAMGYIGGGGTVMGVNPVAAVGGYLPGADGSALNTGLATGVIGAGIGKLSGMSTEDALQMGLTSGASAGITRGFGGMSPDDYAVKSKILTLAEAGDTNATALHDSGNVGNMKAYLANAENQLFKGVPPATDAQMVSLGQRYSPATDAQMANLTSAGGNAAPGQASFPGAAAETGPADFYSRLAPGELSSSPYQSSLRSMSAAPIAEPPGFFDKALTGAGNMYDKYLSPDRAGLPADAGLFRKYGPLAAAGTATIAAFGGMDSSPAEIDPITAGERARYAESRLRAKARRDRIEKGGYGLEGNSPLIYAANGGYIQRFVEGSDEDGVLSNDERRRLAQARRAGYGLEGNLLDTALDQARTGNTARPFEEYVGGVNNSGDPRGPGTDNTGDGQTFYGGLGNLAAEAQRYGFNTLGGFLAGGIPVDAAYKGGRYSIADLAALGNKSAIAGLAAEAALAPGRAAANAATIAGFGRDAGDADVGSARGDSSNDGGGGARAGGGATGGGYMAKGGPAKMTNFPRRDGPINGPGTGTSDDIPAMLSDGEFVFTAKAVRNAGGGSRRKGAARMYKLMKKLEGGAVKGN